MLCGIVSSGLFYVFSSTMFKWLVFAASCTVAWLDFALLFTFGAMFVHLLEEYGDSRARTALVQSLFLGVALTSGLLSGVFVKKFGESRASFVGTVLLSTGFVVSSFAKSVLIPIVFIGIVSGFGVSFIFMSSTAILGRLFVGKVLETALAFHTFSLSFGLVGYPYLLEALVVNYGVRGTFLIIGGLLLNNAVISILFYISESRNSSLRYINVRHAKTNIQISNISIDRRNGSEMQEQPFPMGGEGEVKRSSKFKTISKEFSAFLRLRYILVVIATGLVASSHNGLLVVLLDILTWKELPPSARVNCLTAVFAGEALARVVRLVVSKLRPETAPAYLLVLSTLVGISGHQLILFSTDEKWIVVASVCIGFSIGGVISGATVAVASFVDISHFSPAFGLLLTVFGALGLVLGPLYGYIRDTIQSYEVAIIMTSALYGAGTLLYLATLCASSDRRKMEDPRTTAVTVISGQVVNNRIVPI